MSENLHVQTRVRGPQSSLRQIRHNGWIPGVIYGKNMDGVPIRIHKGELYAWIRKEGRHGLVHLVVDDDAHVDAMIHDLQVDPLDRQVVHIDFHRVQKGQKVNATIPIHLLDTPVGVADGGVLQQQLQEVEVRAIAEALPHALEVSIATLHIGEQLRVSDLTVPEGVEWKTSLDEIIASVTVAKLDPVEAEDAAPAPEMVEMTSDE